MRQPRRRGRKAAEQARQKAAEDATRWRQKLADQDKAGARRGGETVVVAPPDAATAPDAPAAPVAPAKPVAAKPGAASRPRSRPRRTTASVRHKQRTPR